MADLQVFHTGRREKELLNSVIQQAYAGDRPLRVLEAGCGQQWGLKPDGVRLHITGVDTDAAAMRIRREQSADIDAEIVGDLRTVELPAAAFDIVYCSFVLEHVEGAEKALDRMTAALAPGGRLIVRVPDGQTVYGFFVRHSPHRVHVYYKRYVEGFPEAGKPGHAPYPTIYDPVVGLSGLRDYADRHGLAIEHEYGTDSYLNVFRRLRPLVAAMIRLVGRLSSGRLASDHANIGLVLRKPQQAAGHRP